MEIQTCRAKSKRTGKWFYGYLIELWTPKGEEQRYAIDQCSEYDFNGNSTSIEEIDIHTLEYKTPYKACVKDDKGVTCHCHEIYDGDILGLLQDDGSVTEYGNVFYEEPGGWFVGSRFDTLDEFLFENNDRVFIIGNVMNYDRQK
jgi:hypothetical protein